MNVTELDRRIRCQFDVDDFEGCGQWLMNTARPPEAYFKEGTQLATWDVLYKLGYNQLSKDGDWRYCLVAMSDGMILSMFNSKQDLVRFLNTEHSNPNKGWRPATQREIFKAVEDQSSRYQMEI